MTRLFLAFASFSGAMAVLLGAFAAHGLKSQLTVAQLAVFETGVRYQMVHALALLCIGLLRLRDPAPLTGAAGTAMMVGTVLFSGSLYLLSTRELLGIAHWKWLGPITPLGGLAFVAGWVLLGIAVLRWRGL
jgi:uncharacterized membrane protein YgdD (TMEM256/DUF423 family)